MSSGLIMIMAESDNWIFLENNFRIVLDLQRSCEDNTELATGFLFG